MNKLNIEKLKNIFKNKITYMVLLILIVVLSLGLSLGLGLKNNQKSFFNNQFLYINKQNDNKITYSSHNWDRVTNKINNEIDKKVKKIGGKFFYNSGLNKFFLNSTIWDEIKTTSQYKQKLQNEKPSGYQKELSILNQIQDLIDTKKRMLDHYNYWNSKSWNQLTLKKWDPNGSNDNEFLKTN